MANAEHLAILSRGVNVWNQWRMNNPQIRPDVYEANLQGTNLQWADLQETNLEGADLREANLQWTNLRRAVLIRTDIRNTDSHGANFYKAILRWVNLQYSRLPGANFQGANLQWASLQGANLQWANFQRAALQWANLQGANLQWANFQDANLRDANLEGANLQETNLQGANLQGANLQGANLQGANLRTTILQEANLTQADLSYTTLVGTNLKSATLTGCFVYGISAWRVQGTPIQQTNLVITPSDEPTVTVDDLEVAQFIYLLLDRGKLRNVINTITSKAVLILGRFTPERKAVLNAMADELRKYNLLPIIFDFERATTRDFTETIRTLAGLSLFVIADVTNPKSSPLELQATVPDYQIPFIIIMQEGEQPFAMLNDLRKYPWVYENLIMYSSLEKLLQGFKRKIIDRAWAMKQQLIREKERKVETESIEDFIQDNEDQLGG